jgi:hypothetical protein
MYRVIADIEYLDGALAGMVIPSGYSVTFPNDRAAYRCAAWLKRIQSADDFIRAAVTGNRYKVAGSVDVRRVV